MLFYTFLLNQNEFYHVFLCGGQKYPSNRVNHAALPRLAQLRCTAARAERAPGDQHIGASTSPRRDTPSPSPPIHPVDGHRHRLPEPLVDAVWPRRQHRFLLQRARQEVAGKVAVEPLPSLPPLPAPLSRATFPNYAGATHHVQWQPPPHLSTKEEEEIEGEMRSKGIWVILARKTLQKSLNWE